MIVKCAFAVFVVIHLIGAQQGAYETKTVREAAS